MRGREVRRLQGGGGENEQWRRAEREGENLIQAHLPVDVAAIRPERRGPQHWKKKMRKTKAEGK